MSWSVIRKATEEDTEALEKAARRFCDRHEIDYNAVLLGFGNFVSVVEDHISYLMSPGIGDVEQEAGVYLNRLWLACVARALKTPGAEGIAWHTVGYSTKD